MRWLPAAVVLAAMCVTPAAAQLKPAPTSAIQIWPAETPYRPDPKLRCAAQGALMRCSFVPAGGSDDQQGLAYGLAAKQAGATIYVAFSLPLTLTAGKSIRGFEAELDFMVMRGGSGGVKLGGEMGGTPISFDGAAKIGAQSLRVATTRALKGPHKGNYDVILRIDLARQKDADRAAVTLNTLTVRALID